MMKSGALLIKFNLLQGVIKADYVQLFKQHFLIFIFLPEVAIMLKKKSGQHNQATKLHLNF